MIYAHPTFATVLEQAVYRPASTIQRASLSPMPLPAIALVATAVSTLFVDTEAALTYGRFYAPWRNGLRGCV